jgi:hypothetical protein
LGLLSVSSESPIEQLRREEIRKAVCGFLRTCVFLIRHKSDFVIVQQDGVGLVSKGIRHADFIRFTKCLKDLSNDFVSPRYAFGELRLTRLNFWSKAFLRRLSFFKTFGQYGSYFSRFYGPLLFISGLLSAALSSTQVGLVVRLFIQLTSGGMGFAKISRGFTVAALIILVLVIVILTGLLGVLVIREFMFALNDLYKK